MGSRLEEIRQMAERAIYDEYPEKVYGSAAYYILTDAIPYLLSEVDRLNTVRAEYTSNSAEITINGCKYVPKARAEAAEAERNAAIKQMCRFCRTLDKKAGLVPICAADCEWRGQQAGMVKSDADIS